MEYSRSYRASFEILLADFRRMTEFIEPVEANNNTYSHRLYELLLRACTEFESVCRESLVALNLAGEEDRLTVRDFVKLEPELHLEETIVLCYLWRPVDLELRPFDNWSTKQPPLSWYAAYNDVKHRRNSNFSRASLENCFHALAGLFSILATRNLLIPFGTYSYPEKDFDETTFYNYPLTLRRPHSAH